MKVRDIVEVLEGFAPRSLQESYDNSGLIIGDMDMDVSGVLLCTDITPAVISEAVSLGFGMIVSHHPLIFRGIRKIDSSTLVGRCVMSAIRDGIAVYAGHTSFDNAPHGVSFRMAEKLSLQDVTVLKPKENCFAKLSVTVPVAHEEAVRNALARAGTGAVGNYDSCSFTSSGVGRFRAMPGASPYVGRVGELHSEAESRVDVIVPMHRLYEAVGAMLAAHPYETPAYDIVPLMNTSPHLGFGCVGELPGPMSELDFLSEVKRVFRVAAIRHSALLGKPVRRVALCGGSGSDFIPDAVAARADVYLTADISYHHFLDADGRTVIADIGHFESEQFTKEIFLEQLTEKFPNFAVRMAESDTNPVFCC